MVSLGNILIVAVVTLARGSSAQLSTDKDELLNWCLKGKNHKQIPGKEDTLHEQCGPWKDHACCTDGVTRDVHSTDMYNFTLDHCASQTGRDMSPECRSHFVQDGCFYECEPSIGLWVVKADRKIASERFFNVPLCASDCEMWFNDCKNDYTCAFNWPRDFQFSKGRNTCKEGSKCQTFKEVYGSAEEFCENVWDHSWSYAPADQPCIHMWFDESTENPNRKVAEYYINLKLEGNTGCGIACTNMWVLAAIVAAVWWS